MAAINQPGRAPNQMDAISAVLNIGSTLYGIKANRDKLEQDKEQFAAQKGLRESQMALAKQTLDEKTRKSQGRYTPNEIASLAVEKDFTVSNSPLAQSIKLTQVNPDGKNQDVYLSKRVDQGKGLDYQNKLLQNEKLSADIAKTKFETGKDREFNSLDSVGKEQVKLLAQTNAKVLGVKSGLDAGLAQLNDPKLSEDAKVKVGQGMLKILNSAEGADAVGVEEAKRLGSFLEYKLGNVFEPGRFIGRDLDMFTEQVGSKSRELSDRIKNNESAIKGLMGGQSISSIAESQNQSSAPKKDSSVFPEAVAKDLPSLKAGEVRRQTKDGKSAIFNEKTKSFLRYE